MTGAVTSVAVAAWVPNRGNEEGAEGLMTHFVNDE